MQQLSLKSAELILALALIMWGCGTPDASEHSHDASGGHGHPHEEEVLTSDTTIWTDKTELFVEYPVLIKGKTSRFAAHFTGLDGHQAVEEGSVTVSLIQGDKGIRHTVAAPSSPGIFSPSLQLKAAGTYQLIFELKTPRYSDRIVLDRVPVFGSEEEAEAALGGSESDDGKISFLKEQAWKIDFQTTPVVTSEVFEIIPTSGTWKVAPTDNYTLVANTSGKVSFYGKNLTEGVEIKRGQTLMTVNSSGMTTNNLSSEIAQARATYEQLAAEYERNKRLYESRIVPKAEFERIERDYEIAKSNLETLRAGYSGGGKSIASPIKGYLKSILVSNGQFVEQGTPLALVTTHQTSMLEVQVSPSYADRLNAIQDVWYQPRTDVWASMKEKGGSIISVGREIDSEHPLLSVFVQVEDLVTMPEGSFTEAQLAVGQAISQPVIPVSALLEDYGSYAVIVQLSGESFERRPVTIGASNGNQVAVTSGLMPGEMVVSTGAYQVKMASMSGQVPAHGHSH